MVSVINPVSASAVLAFVDVDLDVSIDRDRLVATIASWHILILWIELRRQSEHNNGAKKVQTHGDKQRLLRFNVDNISG